MPTLKLPAIMDNFPQMSDFFCDEAKKFGFDEAMTTQLAIAFEEIVVNVINYGYPDKHGEVEIDCTVIENPHALRIRVTDSGGEFNPLAREDPNIHAPVEERKIGGLGIYMVKQIMDSVDYKYENKMNILTMVKSLPTPPKP